MESHTFQKNMGDLHDSPTCPPGSFRDYDTWTCVNCLVVCRPQFKTVEECQSTCQSHASEILPPPITILSAGIISIFLVALIGLVYKLKRSGVSCKSGHQAQYDQVTDTETSLYQDNIADPVRSSVKCQVLRRWLLKWSEKCKRRRADMSSEPLNVDADNTQADSPSVDSGNEPLWGQADLQEQL